ncbi:hypothetical protein ANN_04437 [Periplaneta americana]|uniref:Histone-lysine N-methyltransferase, H3 lysine-79 specific n=1 Tax=Periplaneta americana TaxID=6978 RepID=A0ABQ8T8K3_PERAM|nr:hypothetical protein ANN_04437 [Periplaneta americana]
MPWRGRGTGHPTPLPPGLVSLMSDSLLVSLVMMLLVWWFAWLGLITAPTGAAHKYLNYTGDIMLGALFPIHHRGSGGNDCGKVQKRGGRRKVEENEKRRGKKEERRKEKREEKREKRQGKIEERRKERREEGKKRGGKKNERRKGKREKQRGKRKERREKEEKIKGERRGGRRKEEREKRGVRNVKRRKRDEERRKEKRGANRKERRPLGRSRRRWEGNIKMDLREVGYDGRHWINLAQDRDQWRAYVRAAMNLRVP